MAIDVGILLAYIGVFSVYLPFSLAPLVFRISHEWRHPKEDDDGLGFTVAMGWAVFTLAFGIAWIAAGGFDT